MGNSSTSSAPSCINDSAMSAAPLAPLAGANFSFLDLLFGLTGARFSEVISHCHVQGGAQGWLAVKIFILLTASPANAALMWILMNSRRSLTPSEVLGLHVSVMDVLSCLSLPLELYAALHQPPDAIQAAVEALFALNVFGCPLLLAFMCLERYMAAARPVAYIRLSRKWYRVLLCACAWTATLGVALLGHFLRLFSMLLCLSAIISLLFLLMLLCLLGIIRVLCQSGPGDVSGSGVPLKRRALKNVVAVTVPAVVAYSPLVALVPYMAVITSRHQSSISSTQCLVLQVLLLFPNFGLFIGPMFYLSRLRQVSCCKRREQSPNSKTQAE